MKKRIFTLLTSLILCLCFCFAACGGDEGGTNKNPSDNSGPSGPEQPDKPNPGEGISATIKMYTSVNIIEYEALEVAAQGYEDYQYDHGNDIHIEFQNTDNPTTLQNTLRNLISNGVQEPTISTISTISPLPEYHGTNKLVDLSGYLEEENPYNPDYETWKDGLEEDAYRPIRAGGTVTTPGVSYSSNYTCGFYNKQAMLDVMGGDPLVDETGTVDTSSPNFTWEWMLGALEKARTQGGASGKKFANPLAVSRNEEACGQVGFNIVTTMINMYLDQYFRDFTSAVHSAEGDYSYIDGIDSAWSYDENDAMVDYGSKYSYNLNQIVDKFFNNSAEYGPESERYAEMMENLHDLMQYSNPDDSYQDCFNRFNETTITYSKSGGYSDMKLFYFETLGYIRTYRDAHKTGGSGGGAVYPSSEWIKNSLGFFLLPAMSSELDGVANNVRPTGGPLENYGVLSTGSTAKDEIAVDFLRWLTSPMGQEQITAHYVSQDAPQMMHQLVKGIKLDPKVDFTGIAMQVKGDIGFCPYNIFGMGSGMTTCTIGDSSDYVRDRVAALLSGYLKGSSRDWTGGSNMLSILTSGFASYADQYHLIYTDPAKVSEATGGLRNNPFNATE